MNRRQLLGSAGAASLLPAAFAAPVLAHAVPGFQAAFRLGPVQAGSGNHQWAEIIAGDVAGRHLSGKVRSGRLDWHADPCSGAVEFAMNCSIADASGRIVELRDRTAIASGSHRGSLPGHPTAPVLSGMPGAARERFVGRLDTTAFWRGFVSLRAFEAA